MSLPIVLVMALFGCPASLDDGACKDDPCANGSCEFGGGGSLFTCTCDPGFKGDRCDVPIETCDDDPCQNGGSCTNDGDAFTCACPAGFTGTRCETATS